MIGGPVSHKVTQEQHIVTATGMLAEQLRSHNLKYSEISGQEVFDAFKLDFKQQDGSWRAISKDQLNNVLLLITPTRFKDQRVCAEFVQAVSEALLDARQFDQDPTHPQFRRGESSARRYQRLGKNLLGVLDQEDVEMAAAFEAGATSRQVPSGHLIRTSKR